MKSCVARWLVFSGRSFGRIDVWAAVATRSASAARRRKNQCARPSTRSVRLRLPSTGAPALKVGTGLRATPETAIIGLWDSLLRVGIGQTGNASIGSSKANSRPFLGLPNDAVVAAPQGQLGLGGNYYAANNNHTNSRQRIREASICELQASGTGRIETRTLRVF